ncbi:MAG: DUF3857 domain-containing protein [Bacteroidetes bacterium]|nr:DUF3857 domain-containing protein [Bacteroidota bacterium]
MEMRLKKIFFSCVLMSPFFLLAQHFNAAEIPDSLKKNANLVTRYEEETIEIKSPGKAISHERHVYTILNEEGDYYARYRSRYDKFTSISNISGRLYDAGGKELKHVKKKDMDDVSGTGDESLMSDTRYKVNDFYCRSYPYTVDYEEDDEINGILYLPAWVAQGINGAAVEDTKFVVIAPKDYVLRYKPVNCSFQPIVTENAGKKMYTWEMKGLPAKQREPLAPPDDMILPYVMIAPSDFEAEGYTGNMNTWEDYGKFMYNLAKGRDALPGDIKMKVHELTDGLKNPKEKINVLYGFMQKNTHYISIQLGIGGWQPFDASYVAAKRYGDCKALSNFMVALLKEAGVVAKTVEIRAGENAAPIVNDFPSLQFNHRIACVPVQNDTVWLECTSQTLPAGYLSSFTADRSALLFDENGGKIVRTPKYGINDNITTTKVIANVDINGNLSAKINARYSGEQQDILEQYINGLSKDKMLERLKSEIDLPTYDIVNFNYAQNKEMLPPYVDETVELTASNYAQASGKRLFIIPDIYTRSNRKLKNDEDRRYGIELKKEYRLIDTVEIVVPPGFEPEALPKDIKIDSKFGRYMASVKVAGDKILYYRLQEQYSGTFPPSDYALLVKFYEDIYKADRAKVVLVKQ